MATISTIAVRLLLDTTAFAGNAVKSASVMGRLSNTLEQADSGLARVAEQADTLATGFERVNASARGYLRTLAAVGGGSVVLARSLKAYAEAQAREREVSRAAGGGSDVPILADAWGRLRDVVDGAYVTFGRAFAESANLHESLRIANSVIQRSQPLINSLGIALGTLWNVLVNYPPVLLLVGLAFQATALAVKLLASYIITQLIVGVSTYLILGKWMTTYQLLTLALTKAKTIALFAYNAALMAYNVIITVATYSTRAFLYVSAALLGTLGLFAAALYGVYLGYKYLTGMPMRLDTGGATEDLKKFKEQIEDIDKIIETASERVRQFGWSEQQKELDKLQKRLAQEGPDAAAGKLGLLPHEAAQRQIELQDLHAKEAALKKQADLAEKLAKLRERALDAARSESQQAIAELRAMGASAEQLAQAQAYVSAQEQATKTLADREQLVKMLADLERTASQARMSEAEKRIDAAKRLGATEQDLARIRAAQAKIDAAASRAQSLAARKAADDRLKGEASRIKDSLLTPLESYQKKMQEIARLRDVGALNDQFAQRAADAADAELRQSLRADRRSETANPQFVGSRGSYQAGLLEDRLRTQDTQTDLQRQQLAEAQKSRTALDRQTGLLQQFLTIAQPSIIQF